MKKRILSALLTIAMALTLLPTAALAAGEEPDASWYDESKSEFTLTTAAQLAGLAQLCNRDLNDAPFAGKTVRLGADIDLTGYDWTPIWWNAGTFDGQGHAIINLNVTRGVERDSIVRAGLFGYAGNGSLLRNFTVFGQVTIESDADNIYAGGVVGHNSGGTIINVGSSVNVTAKNTQTDSTTGCAYAGGIAGYSYKNREDSCILNSYANGDISANANNLSLAGGIAGFMSNPPIINCYYGGGNITAVTNSSSGIDLAAGIAVKSIYDEIVVSNCYSNLSKSVKSYYAPADGDLITTPADLLSKLNNTDVRQQIITEHGVTPMRWKMGESGMPELVFEQFTGLTIGETYWFDLSGVNIPGTVNTALPDGTLHYVPFTYAGTVNAYVLNENSSGVSNSSEQAAAATDPDADYGYCYNHSLFVADYNLKHTVSWDTLNGADLIFGKAYESGGVGYTLRAPSVGSKAYQPNNSPTALHCTPQSNEWDVLAGAGKIKNWESYFSLGQDTYSGSEGNHMLRGNLSVQHARTLEPGENGVRQDRCYRPVLEVPGTLASDALKAVTLDLNGGSVDGEENISIIVKNGASYSAPSDTGLTRPGDFSAGTYFAWRGDNGVTYAPGASVPATVTTLTAQWVDGVVVGDFVVKGGEEGTDYKLLHSTENFLYIHNNTPLTISMKPGVTETGITIVGENAKSINITLAGVNIETSTGAPLDLSLSWDSKLTLADGTTNTLKATGNKPGIYTSVHKLTIGGSGRLDVTGGPGSAGIGGARDDKTGGTIEINGGVINAYGGAATEDYDGSAGIGGSAAANPGTITINGGVIYAEGGSAADGSTKCGGAGIGGRGGNSRDYALGFITINGGMITAQGGTAPYGAGAGIGGSGGSSNIKSVTITGGVINATAGANGAAGIGGGGHGGELINISITGGFITATGTYRGNTHDPTPNPDDPNNANAIGGGASDRPADLSGVTGAVIIDGAANTGKVYGSATLTETAEVPAGVTLTVPENASLTVGAGGVLTNSGIIKAAGTLTKSGGTITNNGEIQYAVKWSLTNVTHGRDDVAYASTKTGYTATLSAAEGYTLPARIAVIVDGTTLNSGYTYNSGSGKLTIDAASVTGKVEITTARQSSTDASGGYTYYTVTVSAGAGGSVSPSGAVSVPRGQDKTFAITPEDGYVIGEVLLDGASVKNKLTGNSYTLANVQKAHTLKVTFIEKSKANPFADVKQDDWFFDDVLFVYENALMNGTSATTFKPGKTTTRGMIAAILYRMAGSPAIEGEILGYPFADVNAEAYYGTAVYWARLNGIVGGYDAEHFGPERPITREQLATILYRYAKYKGYDVSAAEDLSRFSDADKVGAYAADAMRWACGSGLIRGSGGKLTPKGSATRAQVAAILHRFCERFAAQ